MAEEIYLGFDYGFTRIGLAVGQRLTATASPLKTIPAIAGVPNWDLICQVVEQWTPAGLIVGLPTCLDGAVLYTTKASKRFAKELHARFQCPTHLVDERLSTVEARAYLFAHGGYKKIKKTEVDGIAACIILEHWLREK